jgi:hypothetical protein
LHSIAQISSYAMKNATIKKRTEYVYITVPGVADDSPSLAAGDIVRIKVDSDWIDMEVKDTEGDLICLHPSDMRFKHIVNAWSRRTLARKCQVEFVLNRYPLKCMHRAIGLLPTFMLDRLFPESPPGAVTNKILAAMVKKAREMPFFDMDIKNNKEQLLAVS